MRATSDSICRRAAPEFAELTLGVASLVCFAFERGVEGRDGTLKLGGVQVSLGQFLFGFLYLLLNLGELALEGQGALRASAAAVTVTL